MSRLPQVVPEDPSTDPKTAAILSQMFEAWGTDFNILKGVANNGQILEAFATFIGGVYGGMPETERELAYLTTSAVNECFY